MPLDRILTILLICALTACGSPSPTTFSLSISASPQLNVNEDQQPSPVVVRIYDLKSLDAFSSASFFDLYDKDAALLGGEMLGRKEIVMQPGKITELERETSSETKFIGVIAAFRVPTETGWRAWMAARSSGSNNVVIRLDPNAITVNRAQSRFLGVF
jgi:type VI secretion system protein VasD